MPVYVVAQGRIKDRDKLNQYVQKAVPTIGSHGGRVVAFDETPEVVEGTIDLARTVILEFPSREAFRAWYDSPEYQAILQLRLDSAPGTLIVAEGLASSGSD
ncbi:MAG: DUF1330 domain-containing protein [Myxococcota bacterium]